MDKPKAILSPNEAAQIIGCKPDTVRDRYEISRAKLYKMLGINEEEER